MDDMLPNGTRHTTPLMVERAPGWSAGTPRDDSVLSARDLVRAVWRRLWVILLVTLVLVGGTVGLSLYQTPMYQASIKVLVGQERGITETPTDVVGLQQLTQTMAEVAHTRPVANAVIQELDLPTTTEALLANMIVEQVGETQVIEISYVDPDPEKASLVANTIGDKFSEQVSEVSQSANSITATSWERAVPPEYPVSPNPVRNVLLALVLGLMLGVGLALLLEHLDDRWRSPEEAEQISGVPTLGVVRQFKIPKGA